MAGDLPDVRTGHRVTALVEAGGGVRIRTTGGDLEAANVVVCGGLQAETLASAAGLGVDLRTVPFRGSWFELTPEGGDLVRGNIYPVPDPALPFLGVHLTRRADGRVLAGPNAVLSLAAPRLLARALRHPGLYRLAWTHRRAAVRELYWDTFRRGSLRQLQRYVPEVRLEHLLPARPSGIRAQALGRDGHLVDDFVVEGTRRVVHVLNAPSPAATSSLAIGGRVAADVLARR
jgi:L-2-hydroxyglutarate oxidase LhgO